MESGKGGLGDVALHFLFPAASKSAKGEAWHPQGRRLGIDDAVGLGRPLGFGLFLVCGGVFLRSA
jgi:hypothetical protein